MNAVSIYARKAHNYGISKNNENNTESYNFNFYLSTSNIEICVELSLEPTNIYLVRYHFKLKRNLKAITASSSSFCVLFYLSPAYF